MIRWHEARWNVCALSPTFQEMKTLKIYKLHVGSTMLIALSEGMYHSNGSDPYHLALWTVMGWQRYLFPGTHKPLIRAIYDSINLKASTVVVDHDALWLAEKTALYRLVFDRSLTLHVSIIPLDPSISACQLFPDSKARHFWLFLQQGNAANTLARVRWSESAHALEIENMFAIDFVPTRLVLHPNDEGIIIYGAQNIHFLDNTGKLISSYQPPSALCTPVWRSPIPVYKYAAQAVYLDPTSLEWKKINVHSIHGVRRRAQSIVTLLDSYVSHLFAWKDHLYMIVDDSEKSRAVYRCHLYQILDSENGKHLFSVGNLSDALVELGTLYLASKDAYLRIKNREEDQPLGFIAYELESQSFCFCRPDLHFWRLKPLTLNIPETWSSERTNELNDLGRHS